MRTASSFATIRASFLSLRLPIAALLLPFAMARCNCDDGVTGLPEAQIEIFDEDGQSNKTAQPWLTVSFGDADTGQSVTHTLSLRSVGTGRLTITDTCLVAVTNLDEALGSAPCIRSGSVPFTFPDVNGVYPSSSDVDLPVTFSPVQGGPTQFFLRVFSDDVDEPITAVELTGRGTDGRLCTNDAIVDFGEVLIGQTATKQITLTNCGVRPVSVDTLAFASNPDSVFQVSVAGSAPNLPIGPLNEGENLVLDVAFAPTQVRSYRDNLAGNLSLTTAAPYQAFYSLILLGDGREPPSCRLQVVPDVVQFGAVAANTTASRDLVVQSVGECACSVSNISNPTPADIGFSLAQPFAPFVLKGTRGCDTDPPEAAAAPSLQLVTLNYTAPARQDAVVDRATIDIQSNDNQAPSRTVALEANGGGTPFCQLTVTPTGSGFLNLPAQGRYGVVSFGRVTVFGTKKLPIELTNSGNSNCTISNVEWDVEDNTRQNEFSLEFEDGTPVNLGNAPQLTLAPGQTAKFLAVFAPTHVIQSDNPLDVFSFGSYSASNNLCGLFEPNERCNGVKFITNDTRTDVSRSGQDPGVFSMGFAATPVEPAIDVIPGDLDFGLVTLGCGSPPQEVRIYNTGSGDLVIGEPAVEPVSNPAIFSVVSTDNAGAWPYTVAPGNFIGIRVQYHASVVGSQTATLNVPTLESGQAGPPITIPLSGAGTLQRDQTDIFDQATDPKVDILWVVDDSGSMSDDQNQLANNFPSFFTAARVAQTDYHIAVTTTLTVDSSCIPDPFNGTTTCSQDPMAGYYTACRNNDRFLTPQSRNPETQFDCNVRVSETGNVNPSRSASDSAEGGLQAARAFLSSPNIDDPAINGGFLREDAKLHVIIVSDEADQSEGPADLYVDFFRTLKGPRNASLVSVSAVAKRDGETCADGADVGDARYQTVIGSTNGLLQSICDDDWSVTMGNLGLDTLALRQEFFLSRSAENATLQVCVRANGANDPTCVPQTQTNPGANNGYFYDAQTNSIVFNFASIPPRGSRVEVHYETQCL